MTDADVAPWRTIADLLDAVATGPRGRLEAVVDGEHRITFAELAARARRVAGGLHRRGTGPGRRVAIWAPNRWEWVVAACGAWYAGAAVVPISVRARAPEADEILRRTGADVLVVAGAELGGELARLRSRAGATDVVDLDAGPSDAAATPFGELVAGDEPPAGAPRPAPADDCEILFTSGTTGEPKGVRLSHEQILGNYWTYGRTAGFREGDRYLVVVPFGHGGGINGCIMSCLVHGITNVPVARFDAAAALGLIERERVTVVMGPPELFRRIFRSPVLGDHDTSSLRITITGSAITPPELIQELRQRGIGRVINAYGLIEGSAVSMTRADDADEVLSTTVGRPLAGTEVRVVDDGSADVPLGTVGEILVRGPGVMQGYLDAPDLTAAAIGPDGWLRTGDAGTLDADGNLRIVDRKKEMYIVAGFNVYPAEVERCLARHPRIEAATVVAVALPGGREAGHAFVVRRDGEPLDADGVRAWAAEHLADYKVPRSVSFVDELPLNATGKADRKVLRARAQQEATA